MPDPTIDDLKALQARLDLRDVHVCWLGPTNFVIAHTDEERASIPLEQCKLHLWLLGASRQPMPTGRYRVTHDEEWHGPYPWDFVPMEVHDA